MRRLVIFVVAAVLLTGCNKQMVDTTQKYEYAIIQMPGGYHVQGDVQSWRDFKDGDQLQVKINGVTYLTSANNVLLMTSKP